MRSERAPRNLLAWSSPPSNACRRGWSWLQPSTRPPCSMRPGAWASEKWKPRFSRQAAVSSLSRHPQLLTPNPHVFETRGKEVALEAQTKGDKGPPALRPPRPNFSRVPPFCQPPAQTHALVDSGRKPAGAVSLPGSDAAPLACPTGKIYFLRFFSSLLEHRFAGRVAGLPGETGIQARGWWKYQRAGVGEKGSHHPQAPEFLREGC